MQSSFDQRMGTLIDIVVERFINRDDLYYVQWVNPWAPDPKKRHGYDRRDEIVTPNVVLSHLSREITIGLPAMDENGNCKFCVWDNDHENGNLSKIEAILRYLGLYPLIESIRPGREGHLWLFFDKKISARDLLRFDQFIRAKANLVVDDELEFMPKQTRPNDANGIRMPFGINLKEDANGAMGWFEGPSKILEEQLEWFAQQPLNSADGIISFVAKLREQDVLNRPAKRPRKDDGGLIDPEIAYADLEPEEAGDYWNCLCPQCGEPRAYFYSTGFLQCNRVNNCGYRISLADWLLLHPELLAESKE